MQPNSFPGEELRACREARGVSVYEVFRNTRIPTRYVEAIENGMFQDLPGECYVVGFLRTYCAFLGIDPERFVDSFRASSRRPVVRFLRRRPDAALQRPMWLNELATWATILGIVALGWLTYTIVLRPQAQGPETRVQAGTVDLVLPPTPMDEGR